MTSRKTLVGKCSRCGFEGDHDIVAMHTDGIGFCIGMECPACGMLVPEKAWTKYQRTGNVVVPNLFRGNKMTAKGSRHFQ